MKLKLVQMNLMIYLLCKFQFLKVSCMGMISVWEAVMIDLISLSDGTVLEFHTPKELTLIHAPYMDTPLTACN